MASDRILIVEEFLEDSELDVLLVELEEDYRTHCHRRSRTYIRRNFQDAHEKLFADYFAENSRFTDKMFLRRFRMSKPMFLKIVRTLETANEFFIQKVDAVGKPGLTSLQKCCAAIKMLAYGTASDAVDEYIQMGDSTAMICLKQFCGTLIKSFGPHYLRSPNQSDLARLMQENAERGFPGMVGSIDCWHWIWESCPTAYKGQFKGKEGKPTIILEAVASYNTHIWHCFFGSPGSLNDINVLDRSPLLHDIMNNDTLAASYELNGKVRHQGYLLADGIYPEWPIFVKTISNPNNAKEKLFAKLQESLRKDVERAFGILRKCWHILACPARLWHLDVLNDVMQACIILHNMRIDYRTAADPFDEDEGIANFEQNEEVNFEPFEDFCAKRARFKNCEEFFALRNDLIDHVWLHHGNQSFRMNCP